jgi:hypothetical protein
MGARRRQQAIVGTRYYTCAGWEQSLAVAGPAVRAERSRPGAAPLKQ